MWIQFFIDFALLLFLIYVPGVMFGAVFRISAVLRFACAPIISIAAYEVLAIVYEKIGIVASFTAVALPVLFASIVFCVAVLAIRREKNETNSKAQTASYSWWLLVAYALVGVAVGMVFFVKPLDGSDTFLQAWDNAFHLNAIRCFLDSGNYSTLAVTIHSTIGPNSGTYYYPAAYHMLCAMIVDATGGSIPTCVNAVNFAFASVVFPAGMYCFIERASGFCRTSVYAGIFLTSAFVSYPWTFLVFGPLFPNLASMAIMPPALVAAMDLFAAHVTPFGRLQSFLLLVISIFAFGVTQPNAVFTAIVILLPFVFSELRVIARERGMRLANIGIMPYCALCAACMVGLWWIFYIMPPLHAPYTMNWAAFTTRVQAFANVLFVAYIRPQASLVLALLVLVGCVGAIKRKCSVWMVVSYGIVCFMLIVGESTEGIVKTFLTGLWYTDQYRIAAMVGLAATPLACMGAAWGLEWLKGWYGCVSEKLALRSTYNKVRNTSIVVAILILFTPCFSIPGIAKFDTPFGSLRKDVAQLYSATSQNALDAQERGFLEDVARVIPDDSLVINQAFDGSIYAYALTGLNTYYRAFGEAPSEGEANESKIIRNSLNELASNCSVQEAVEDLGAKYLLVLDYEKGDTAEGHSNYYVPSSWKGINDVSDETPGFEIVLAKGDMRLYRLNY